MEVIHGAGEKALAYYGKGNTQVKFDEDLVTEAELTLTEFFQLQLHSQFPEHQVFGNTREIEKYTHESKRYLWVFDALDGVANFQAGIPIWGISLALLENFWPIFGVFYMPVTNDLFHAHAGDKAHWREKQIRISYQQDINDESLLLTSSRFHLHYKTTFPGKIRDLGCTSAHLCYVAAGRAEGAIISNESYQDLAAARVIIEAAGGRIYRMDGREFLIDEYLAGQKIDEYLLVLAPDIYSQIRNCLRQAS